MPDRLLTAPAVLASADLRLEVSKGGVDTTARLRGDDGALVLDVDDPVQLARSAPAGGRPLWRLPARLPAELSGIASVRLRSRGSDLGTVRVREDGRLRWRPTAAGMVVGARAAGSSSNGRIATWVLAAAGVAVAVAVLTRRPRPPRVAQDRR